MESHLEYYAANWEVATMSELLEGESLNARPSRRAGDVAGRALALTQAKLKSHQTEALVSAAGRALSQSSLRAARLFVSTRALHPVCLCKRRHLSDRRRCEAGVRPS